MHIRLHLPKIPTFPLLTPGAALSRPTPGTFGQRSYPPASTPPPSEAAGPHLRRLLALADRKPDLEQAFMPHLYAQFDAALTARPPAAALTALAHGVDTGTRFWLRADPIHLQAQRDDLTVLPVTDLSAMAAEGLLATLNDFLAADDLALRAATENEWLLSLARPPGLRTTPLALASGGPMGHYLPSGEDAREWMGRLTELQMLLHDHPINVERESQGKVPVNALWLWGEGVLTAPPPCDFDLVCARDSEVLGLALHAGVKSLSVPPGLEALPPARCALVVFDQDIDFAALDAHWISPLMRALHEKRIELLDLCMSERITLRFQMRPRHLWRFWRRAG